MENFEVALAKSNRLINNSLMIGVSFLAIGLVVCVGLYMHVFNGGLSSQSADWSALGSFFGGVFGPGVSLVTLIALLKTLKLQHQTLISQKTDSAIVIALQQQSYTAQADQLLLAQAELSSARIADFKNSLIRVFEQRVSYYQHCQADALNRVNIFLGMDETPAVLEALGKINEKTIMYRSELDKLLKLSLQLAVKDFDSIDDVKAFVKLYTSDDSSPSEP